MKGKGKQKPVQQCLSEVSSESDEGTTFRNRASGPSKASIFFGRTRRPPHPRVRSESDGDVIVPGGASGPSEASSSGRPQRQCQLPSRFRDNSTDDNDSAICMICGKNEPDGLGAEIVFWIDCSVCGQLAHNVCVFGRNTVTRQYVCQNCT